MSEPHVIRLREPWDREPSHGGGRYRRFFNKPTGLTSGTTVRLVCDGPIAAIEVMLNGVSLDLPTTAGLRRSHDVTHLLAERNEVVVSVAYPPASAELPWREVLLEIHSG